MTIHTNPADLAASEAKSFVTFRVADQLFGVPVTEVQDILAPDAIAPVPGGPADVRGLINLRGRIVTVIDMRTRLSLPPQANAGKGMCVTVECRGDAYTLLVDAVGDVITLSSDLREGNPHRNQSLASRLPDWMKSSKNRAPVTHGLQRLRERLGED